MNPMKHTKTKELGQSINHNYIPFRWTLLVPAILKEFWNDGVRFYKTDDGKTYDADIYDQKLAPQSIQKRKLK